MTSVTASSIRLLALTLLITTARLDSACGQEVEIVKNVPAGIPAVHAVRAMTQGPRHHFFGYFGISPWDEQGRLVCLEVEFGDRLVKADDAASICLIDPRTRELKRIAETNAWNLQQGCMLHWLGKSLLYNDRINGELRTVVLDTTDGTPRLLERPINALSPDGKTAIALNYDRLRAIRPVTGYAGGPKVEYGPRPKNDGLWLVDVASGKSKLLVSVDQACQVEALPDYVADRPLWLEHPIFNRDGTRLFFILRANHNSIRRMASIPLAINTDGSKLGKWLPWGIGGASHFDWLDDQRLALVREVEPGKWRHILLTDDKQGYETLDPDVLVMDGHCSFSPDRRWMITDSYPDENRRQHLFVLNVKSGKAARIASFHTPPEYTGNWRCDLHPRWSPDSRSICIDSTHSGIRQLYVVELDVER